MLNISRGWKTLWIVMLACGLSSCFTSKSELIPLSEAADPMGKVSFIRYGKSGEETVLARVQDRPEYFYYNEKDKPDHTLLRFSRLWSAGSLWTPQYVLSGGPPSKSGRFLALLVLDRSNMGTVYVPKEDRTISSLASAKTALQDAVRKGTAVPTMLGQLSAISKKEADGWLQRYRQREAKTARDRLTQSRNGAVVSQQRQMATTTPTTSSRLFDSELVKIVGRTDFQNNWCFSGGWANVNLALRVDVYFLFSPFNADYERALKNFVVPAVRARCTHRIDRINVRNHRLVVENEANQARWDVVNWITIIVKDGAYAGYETDGSFLTAPSSYEKQRLEIEKLKREADDISRELIGRY
jgi:hypothetical protein